MVNSDEPHVCRTTPYQDVVTDGAHLARSYALVEEAYSNTGLPVYLMGHSNGPLYALALLHNAPAEWRSKYIGVPPICPFQWADIV